ncbi:MAG: tetratricopeptide repeat-containing protein [Methyloligellaceae bacterium]
MDDALTDAPVKPAELWYDTAKAEERKGEYLSAYDLAKQGLINFPDDDMLKYLAVLALARSGAIAQAESELREYGLAQRLEADGAALEPKLAEDIAALSARLAKDRALLHGGAERKAGAARAAALYKAIYDGTGGYYPGINAASMSLLGGDDAQARALAEEVIAKCAERHAAEGVERYYVAATEAEAALLLDDLDGARAALQRAAESQGRNLAAVATTRKQLRLICEAKDIDAAILEPLAPPLVVHFVGHMIAAPGKGGRFPAEMEDHVAQEIAAYLDRHPVGFAYGSLACGTDILFAEALIARGAEVHAFLPFDMEEFKATSVTGGGARWLERFDACMEAVTSVAHATDDLYMDDDALFSYASQLAMGTALLRAEHIDAEPVHIAV